MLLSPLAVGCAIWIYKQLYLILVGQSFKLVKSVVPVVIEDNKLIILFKLCKKCCLVLKLLHSRRNKRIQRVILSYVFLQHGHIHDYLVKSVFRNSRNHIAERVRQIFFSDKRIGECISDRYSTGIVLFYDTVDELTPYRTHRSSSAVPRSGRKAAV